ncbi:4-hydroxy-tetrahydrodipicolinate synthase [Anaerococcus sp. AGMB00486]|uniref:4-hydroxy-tetrahydrodipicolinate synthase n=2 Tax=Anaerococcus TaxID=165779 RepID=A0ABX2N8G3_9FIRM|nr:MULTISPECIES: 4-hydroxy-tetrahydrodipicolinate synthase [Anaerococcus]MDY3006238.1 4-hydroxy-tetrahydrodipicolinate synthase [Anaerococcus porci]MSS77210.1 4-hydroxy-tetrahydrodipicolinate synthase [Anaerococcus porci]NVF10985.1 4-hydroxy-tetrahydrodipicolinate synthase [Anaerococcus faecalis]
MLFEGSGVAIVTPFNEDLSVDYEAYRNLIKFHLENHTDAIVALGTTAEAACLSECEKMKLIDISIDEIKGKIPLIVGTGSNNTNEAIRFSKKVSEIDGVDALLLVTPYYNKCSQEGLYKHYKEIANNSIKPIILYNVPGRTNVNIEVETVKRLSKIENIVGIKDAKGDLAYTTNLRKVLPKDFAIYSGNDDVITPLMSVGGNGVISVLANIYPKEVHDLVKYALDGNFEKSASIQLKYFNLIKALFVDVNPIGIKFAGSVLKLYKNELRLPLTKASEKCEILIKNALEDLND